MKFTKEQQKGQELMHELATKSWESATFKEQLISNPKEVIENVSNGSFELKDGYNIVVDDQTDESKIYLNIPRKAEINDFELTDEEMEMVAGGIIAATLGVIAAGATLVAFGGWLYHEIN